ncbi:gamma-mobile-trio integrase GmtZ [Comamonas testosteroni]|uniref:gamma-mobile-trio integrase GmtZ n=2 Tax=Comamonas testosteroni TaxID=285 RepID=UPI0006B92856|nr:VPA1269 family protein [Comamonas testosteroni]
MPHKNPYPVDVRDEAIRRVKAGESKSKVARELGISMETIGRWTPGVTSHRPIPLALRDQVVERVRNGESKRKVAMELGIGKTTVMWWTKDINHSVKHPNELREQAIARAKAGERATEIAKSLGLPPTTVMNWVLGINPRKRMTQAIREEAIRRVEAGEVKRTVALDLGISAMAVSGLTRHIKRGAIAPELRQTFIERVNQGETLSSVSRDLGVSLHAYRSWRRLGLAPYPEVSEEQQCLIMADVDAGTRIDEVALKHRVPTPLVRDWIRRNQGKPQQGKRYSIEVRTAAIKRAAAGERAQDIADSLGISRAAVDMWARAAVARGEVSILKPIPKTDDLEFLWISKRYPFFEDWRMSMAGWIQGEARGLGQRISALAAFVERYLACFNLPATREEFFRKGRVLPDFYAALSNDTNDASKHNNTIHQFLQWVLLHDFSDTDDDGKPVVSSLYRNPIPLVSKAGAPRRMESVRDVLPYGFIVQFRERIAAGPHFGDWSFAQTALGLETITSNNTVSDWFEVTEDRIDKQDPDCVWRLRKRLQKPPVLEMWSPVRWVALLLKLMIPARTGQIRVCDSGESDTWRYEDGKFLLNTGALASGTERSPWAMGMLRRIGGCGGDETVVLYLNTNKTADAMKSGSDKGQECPWPRFDSITENPYYWIEKLRNWQEKYNPISRRVKWAELPSKRSLGVKSEMQKASYADTCFLFRTPESPGEEQWPITNTMLQKTWQKLMNVFEREFSKKGIKHPDGSSIVFNNPRNGRTFYPPHGLRVSLITAMVIDGQVPPDLMMKIVGHSRLIMTLYYTKPGYSRLRDAIVGAAERLEVRKDESILRFLTDTSNEEMIKHVAFNAENWQAVIAVNPANRNPVGWLLMHDGICFAGGNTGPLDGNQRVPGCHNGGPLISASDSEYGPVPGGPMNCSLCRWKAAEAHHGPGLVASMNNQLYNLRLEQEIAVKQSATMTDLKKQKAREEAAQIPFGRARDLKAAERLYEASMERLATLSASVAGTYKMIQRLKAIETQAGSGMVMVSAGDIATMNAVLDDTNSELLQLAGICSDVEIYPDLNPGKAVFRMSQLLDNALMREAMSPFFMQLSEEQQLRYGNAFMRSLARQANAANPLLGLREVVSIMDSGESLQTILGVRLPDFLPAGGKLLEKVPPLRLTIGE